MPRTKEQNKKILDQRKQEIINCAIDIFTVKNYKDVTVDDITKKLKISHGLFYHYFRNRNDLIQTIIEHAKSTVLQEFIEISNTYKDEEFFVHYFTSFLKCLKHKETTLLLNFLNNVVKDVLLKDTKPSQTILDKFYQTAFSKNIKSLHQQGKLLQNVDTTFKLMGILTNGLITLAVENKLQKGNISVKNILKTIIIFDE